MPFKPDYFVPAERLPYTLLSDDGQNGRIGILVIHGFMGSPLSSRPLANYLYSHGFSLHCPLLPGHGNYPEKLHKVPRSRWYAEVEEAYHRFRSQCDQLFIIGHSMGAFLGSHLAIKFGDISGIVMITPLYQSPDYRITLMKYVHRIMPWFYPHLMKSMRDLVRQRVLDFDPTIDFDDPVFQKKVLPKISRLSTSSLAEMVKMVEMGRTYYPQLQTPTIIFQGGQDPAIVPGSIEKIVDLIPHEDKQLITFPQAGHELMRPADPVHTEVWQTVLQFIQKRAGVRVETAV